MPDVVQVPVWRRCILVGIVVLAICWCCWYWWWRCPHHCQTADCDCPDRDHIEAFIVPTSTGYTVEDGAGNSMVNDLDTSPGDVVIWSNETSDTAWVDFRPYSAGTPFVAADAVLMIPPKLQRVARVRDDAGGTPPVVYDYTLKIGAGSGSGGPKVKVGG